MQKILKLHSITRKTNMMLARKVLVISIALVCLSSVDSGVVTKCKSDDSNCALESTKGIISKFASGLPEYQVKTLDPVTFKKIDASSPSLKLILTDVTLTGMKNCVPKKVKRDNAKKKIFLKFLCSCQLEGQYEMDGQLLILPIKGKGPLHVTLRKLEVSLDLDMGEKNKNGAKYWHIKEWNHSFALKDKSDVVFENLFDGNEVLAQAARTVISESGNEIILEVGPPVLKTVVAEVVSNVNSFFHHVPAEELSLD